MREIVKEVEMAGCMFVWLVEGTNRFSVDVGRIDEFSPATFAEFRSISKIFRPVCLGQSNQKIENPP